MDVLLVGSWTGSCCHDDRPTSLLHILLGHEGVSVVLSSPMALVKHYETKVFEGEHSTLQIVPYNLWGSEENLGVSLPKMLSVAGWHPTCENNHVFSFDF